MNDPDIVLYKHTKNNVAVTYNEVVVKEAQLMKVLILKSIALGKEAY